MTIAEAKALLLPLFKMGYVDNIVSFKADGESFVCYRYTCPFDKVEDDFVRFVYTEAVFKVFENHAKSVVVGMQDDVTIIL